MKISELPAVQLVNPWSKATPPALCLTWAKIRKWAFSHVHPSNRKEWLKAARDAYRNDDGDTLGAMIIGS